MFIPLACLQSDVARNPDGVQEEQTMAEMEERPCCASLDASTRERYTEKITTCAQLWECTNSFKAPGRPKEQQMVIHIRPIKWNRAKK